MTVKRATMNASVDAAAFAAFVVMTSTGLVLRWTLPPGSGRLDRLGNADDRSVEVLWGLTRHQWGNLHYWAALGLFAVLTAHILLHWRFVVNVVRGQPRTASGGRLAVGVVSLVGLAAIAAAPLVAPTRTVTPAADSLAIRGDMTLRAVATAANVPIEFIVEEVGLPNDLALDEPLGRLRRRHGFELRDIRRAVTKCRETQCARTRPGR